MLPHEAIVPSFALAGGATIGVKIPLSYRGTLKTIRVIQLTGTLEGFSYVIYNTFAACDLTGAAASGVNEKLYRKTPILTVTAGQDSYASTEGYPEDGINGLDIPYANLDNHDGTPLAGTSTSRGNYLMLKVTAAGSLAKTFGVAITYIDPFI